MLSSDKNLKVAARPRASGKAVAFRLAYPCRHSVIHWYAGISSLGTPNGARRYSAMLWLTSSSRVNLSTRSSTRLSQGSDGSWKGYLGAADVRTIENTNRAIDDVITFHIMSQLNLFARQVKCYFRSGNLKYIKLRLLRMSAATTGWLVF